MAKPITHRESSEAVATVRTRFDGIDRRFDCIDRRLEAIDHRIETLTDSFGHAIAQAIVTIDQNAARQIRASEERLRVEIARAKIRIESCGRA